MPWRAWWTDPRRLRWVAAAVSGSLYGGWAVIQNQSAAAGRLTLIGGVQFLVSLAATLLLSSMIICLIGGRRSTAAATAAATVVSAGYAAALIATHLAVATPNLARTVLPIIAIAGLYAFWFAFRTVAANAAADRSGVRSPAA